MKRFIKFSSAFLIFLGMATLVLSYNADAQGIWQSVDKSVSFENPTKEQPKTVPPGRSDVVIIKDNSIFKMPELQVTGTEGKVPAGDIVIVGAKVSQSDYLKKVRFNWQVFDISLKKKERIAFSEGNQVIFGAGLHATKFLVVLEVDYFFSKSEQLTCNDQVQTVITESDSFSSGIQSFLIEVEGTNPTPVPPTPPTPPTPPIPPVPPVPPTPPTPIPPTPDAGKYGVAPVVFNAAMKLAPADTRKKVAEALSLSMTNIVGTVRAGAYANVSNASEQVLNKLISKNSEALSQLNLDPATKEAWSKVSIELQGQLLKNKALFSRDVKSLADALEEAANGLSAVR